MFFTFEKSITKYAIVFLLANRSYIIECSLFRYLAHIYVMRSECVTSLPPPPTTLIPVLITLQRSMAYHEVSRGSDWFECQRHSRRGIYAHLIFAFLCEHCYWFHSNKIKQICTMSSAPRRSLVLF